MPATFLLACQFILLPAQIAASAETSGKAEPAMPALIERMAVDGRGFNPQPLLDRGVSGMRAVLDYIFPETMASIDDRRAPVKRLIEQLGDDSFQRREDASATLRKIGRPHAALLRRALVDQDPEVRFRVQEVLNSWKKETAEKTRRIQATYAALHTYLEKLDDSASQQELARRVTLALNARLDQTTKERALNICLQAMARWKDDAVHEKLLPLLEHEDPAVAIFAMRGIAGRTGNSYIAPIHRGAIASGRRELVKCGFRSMPCPIWDRKNKPIVREAYVKLFDATDEQWDFSDDEDFMRLSAFVAARDFHITKARDWLLQRMGSDDKGLALRAIRSLGDTYYMRRPIYPELLAAVEPHLESENPKYRAAAIYTVGVYQGDAVPPLLLKGLADPNNQVWQTAGRRLADQHSYHPRDKSPISKLLADAIEQADDTVFLARAKFLLSYLQQERPGDLKWPSFQSSPEDRFQSICGSPFVTTPRILLRSGTKAPVNLSLMTFSKSCSNANVIRFSEWGHIQYALLTANSLGIGGNKTAGISSKRLSEEQLANIETLLKELLTSSTGAPPMERRLVVRYRVKDVWMTKIYDQAKLPARVTELATAIGETWPPWRGDTFRPRPPIGPY